jgi:hypothetical protein
MRGVLSPTNSECAVSVPQLVPRGFFGVNFFRVTLRDLETVCGEFAECVCVCVLGCP